MPFPSLRRLTAGASVAALMALAIPAGAADTVAVDITRLRAKTGGTVEVSANVDVASDPIVFNDATGDSPTPGTDISSAEFELVDDRTAVFRVNFANPLPAIGSTTVPMVFWEFSANGSEQQLSAMHNRFSAPGDWSYELQTCTPDPQTGSNTCSGAPVPGSYADGVLEMEVSLSQLGGFGSTITQAGDGVYTTFGGAGLIWNGTDFFDGVSFAPINIPELEVTAVNDTTGATASTSPSRGTVKFDVAGSAGDSITVTADFGDSTATASGVAG